MKVQPTTPKTGGFFNGKRIFISDGGEKLRTASWPARGHFGEEEKQAAIRLFDQAIESGNPISYNGPDGKPVDKFKSKKETKKTKQAIAAPTSIAMLGHQIQIQDMVKAVRNDREPIVPGEEGRKRLEIILGIYKSSKSGKAVKLPL